MTRQRETPSGRFHEAILKVQKNKLESTVKAQRAKTQLPLWKDICVIKDFSCPDENIQNKTEINRRVTPDNQSFSKNKCTVSNGK